LLGETIGLSTRSKEEKRVLRINRGWTRPSIEETILRAGIIHVSFSNPLALFTDNEDGDSDNPSRALFQD